MRLHSKPAKHEAAGAKLYEGSARNGEDGNQSKTVYAIRCTETGRVYIGCCSNVESRIAQHVRELENGEKTMRISHHERGNTPWQDDFNAHGKDTFKAYILEENIPADEAEKVELRYILQYRANEPEFGYNVKPTRRPVFEYVGGTPPLPQQGAT